MGFKEFGLIIAVLLGPFPLFAADYVVLKGDSLSVIALKSHTAESVLRRANPETDWERLKAGLKVWIPDSYRVKSGDTLYSLTKAWGVDQSSVLALNGLTGSALKAGQLLYIPPQPKVKAPVVTTTPAAPFWPVEKTPVNNGDKLKSVAFSTSGEPFRSVSAGTVTYLGEFRGTGRVLLVQGVDGVVFAYGNFESASVEFGQTVSRGQELGVTSARNSQKLSFFAFKENVPVDVFTAKR